jgi:tripeptide aminopeptidase
MINQQRILDEFISFVTIKASTLAEREAGDLLKRRLAELQVDITEDNTGEKIGGNCGNILAYIRGNRANAPIIMLSAHLDCVEPCAGIKPLRKDGIIMSAGDTILGADDKAGVVAILEALRVLRENDLPHGDIQLVFTVAEEGGLKGSKNLDQALLKADMGYALDAGGPPGEVIITAPGQNSINIVVHGKTAHAGIAPEEGINAIILAGKALAQLNQGRIDEETTANVGIIKGGMATNIVPDKVEVRCEARSRNAEKLDQQTKHIVETFARVVAENGGTAAFDIKRAYEPFELDSALPVVSLAKKAAEAIGLTSRLTGTGGGSDANFFNTYGIPCAVLGIGMSKVHTTEEFIKESDLFNIAAWVVAIIRQAADMQK